MMMVMIVGTMMSMMNWHDVKCVIGTLNGVELVIVGTVRVGDWLVGCEE